MFVYLSLLAFASATLSPCVLLYNYVFCYDYIIIIYKFKIIIIIFTITALLVSLPFIYIRSTDMSTSQDG